MQQSLLIESWPGHYAFFSTLRDFANTDLLSEAGLRSVCGVSAWFFVLDERIERARQTCNVALPAIVDAYRERLFDQVYATRITLEGTSVLRAVVSAVAKDLYDSIGIATRAVNCGGSARAQGCSVQSSGSFAAAL